MLELGQVTLSQGQKGPTKLGEGQNWASQEKEEKTPYPLIKGRRGAYVRGRKLK